MNRSRIASFAALSTLGLIVVPWAAGSGSGSHAGLTASSVLTCCVSHHAFDPITSTTAPQLTLEGANRVLSAATAKAHERHAGGAIAVVDAGGHLIALQRLDGTFAAGASVSVGKARTAAIFQKPTAVFEDSINTGRIALAAVSEMTPLRGGIPIKIDGFVVGGIGVSGAHSQAEDEEIALAGAMALADEDSAAK